MRQIDELILLIEEKAVEQNVRIITLCARELNDPNVYDRLKSGSKKITVEKLERSITRLKLLKAPAPKAEVEA